MAGKNVNKLNSIIESDEELSKKEICLAIYNMQKEDLISSQDDMICISPKLNDMLNAIKDANHICIVYSIKEIGAMECYYLSDDGIIGTTVSDNDENAIRIAVDNEENIKDRVLEQLSQDIEYRVTLDEDSVIERIETMSGSLGLANFLNTTNLQLVIEDVDMKTGSVPYRICVWRQKEGTVIHSIHSDEIRSIDSDTFTAILTNFLRRDK